MDKYNKERIEMIVLMLMHITKLPKENLIELVKNTTVYKNIINDDEITLYDSYSANLMEMVEEWKNKNNISNELKNISEEDVMKCNEWLAKNEL